MNNEQKLLLKLLKNYLTSKESNINTDNVELNRLCNMADKHVVLPFLYDYFADHENISEGIKDKAEYVATKTVLQSYRLLFLCKGICEACEKEDIPVAILKGVGTASYYKVPELRKTGDVDILLLDEKKADEAVSLLEKLGFTKEREQSSIHHIAFRNEEGIEIELHTMLAEPFDNEKMNSYMESILKEAADNVKYQDILGVTMPILDDGFHSYELMLHMLQHFLRSGFGLKLLCDWVVFWNREVRECEKEKYVRLVTESGIKDFSDMITLVCVKYLGLKEENVKFMNLSSNFKVESFVEEIFEAEEFGKSSKDRMVTMRGSGLFDYIREFHHQMRLNFPKTGKCFLLWPVLWIITLFRFVKNNRIIRKTSTYSILKKAGNRSKMMEQLGLFKY